MITHSPRLTEAFQNSPMQPRIESAIDYVEIRDPCTNQPYIEYKPFGHVWSINIPFKSFSFGFVCRLESNCTSYQTEWKYFVSIDECIDRLIQINASNTPQKGISVPEFRLVMSPDNSSETSEFTFRAKSDHEALKRADLITRLSTIAHQAGCMRFTLYGDGDKIILVGYSYYINKKVKQEIVGKMLSI